MASLEHSLGPACAYHEDTSETNPSNGEELAPVKAQFFYVSLLPIDDPLSPVPAVQAEKLSNIIPQPFSIRDNGALEKAWQKQLKAKNSINDQNRPSSRGLTRMTSFPAFESGLKSPEDYSPATEASVQEMLTNRHERQQSVMSTKSANAKDEERSLKSAKKTSPKFPRRSSLRSISSRSRNASQVNLEDQVAPLSASQELRKPDLSSSTDLPVIDTANTTRQRTHSSPIRKRQHQRRTSPESSMSIDELTPTATVVDTAQVIAPNVSATNVSGRPFARAPSSRQVPSPASRPVNEMESNDANQPHEPRNSKILNEPPTRQGQGLVPVGISRLHLVQFPEMQMKPIYWSPVNDISSVIRATWFYKDTMLPIPIDVANRLERGYEDMRPFAATYQDELDACVEHGAAAELKVVHKLWPDEKPSSRPSTSAEDGKNLEEVATEETVMPISVSNAAADPRKPKTNKKLFESYSVIYVNARDAQILRPNALPSVSRKRTPLNAIRRGRSLGISVVRGFDRKTWQKLHPDPKYDAKMVQAKMGALMAQAGNDLIPSPPTDCPKCDEEESMSKVSDLVLVIHGIGQKLSERVDSYHFTHAINELRREFNVEMANEAVRGTVGNDKGMMVLPVNWRLTVTFDEGQHALENQYGLEDITPETLPAVRSLISDVMLDIPYYMSHHKSKMTSAVIREANRVYRLWCRNNPGFEQNGRVHVVAHSLGSVMAMEILSNQPTFVSPSQSLSSDVPSEKFFEFNTTNLFCCGSPSGFFLLLNGANLIPRRGRNKPGVEGEDSGRGVSGEQGKYGCLAVDNVYNICHRNDPIAYCQNACVDSSYASSLEIAPVPSATQSLFAKIGSSLRWTSTSAHDAYGSLPTAARPSMAHMPSTVELETHNFTQEEIAEKRMFLLNDNGQIDYFLSSGGGPLEIQYLNMLGAHSSYWILQDFVRFLVVEIGRKPGKQNTLPALRARKKRQYKRGTLP